MGVKVVMSICGIAIVTSLLNLTGALLPMHRLRFVGVIGFTLADMRTHLTWIDFNAGDPRFCGNFQDASEKTEAFKKDKDADKHLKKEKKDSEKWCKHLKGGHDIQDVAMHMCSPLVKLVWPEFCDGLNAAHGLGVSLIVAMSANLLLQVVGCYLLYDYCSRKANPMYRALGGGLVASGGVIYGIVLLTYYFSVVRHLDQVRITGLIQIFLTVDKADGTGGGLILCVIACIVQFTQIALLPFVTREDMEDDYLDQKMMKEEAREYGATGFGMAPGAQSGMQHGGTHQGGMQQTGMVFASVQPTTVVVGGPMVVEPMPMTTVAHFEQTVVVSGGGPAATYNAGPSAPRELGV